MTNCSYRRVVYTSQLVYGDAVIEACLVSADCVVDVVCLSVSRVDAFVSSAVYGGP